MRRILHATGLIGIMAIAFLGVGCLRLRSVQYPPGIEFRGQTVSGKLPRLDDQSYISLWVTVVPDYCPLILHLGGKPYELVAMTINDVRKAGADIGPDLGSGELNVGAVRVIFRFNENGRVRELDVSCDSGCPPTLDITYKGRGTIRFPVKHNDLVKEFGRPRSVESVLQE